MNQAVYVKILWGLKICTMSIPALMAVEMQ